MRTLDYVMGKLRGLLPAFDEPPPEDDAKRIEELEARIAKLEGLARPKDNGRTASTCIEFHPDPRVRTYPLGGERSPEYEPWIFSGKRTR